MKLNPFDGDRAAIAYDNLIERNASEKRWDAYYQGCKDKRNHKAYFPNYTSEEEINMYEIGWNNVKKNLSADKRKK